MPTLQSLNDAATAVQTAVAALNTAVTAAKAEGVAVELRVNYTGGPAMGSEGAAPVQAVVATTTLPLPLPVA